MKMAMRKFSSGISPEYAFEMAASSIRFGRGATKEIGYDLIGMGITKNVCIVTDPHMATLPPFSAVCAALNKANIQFEVFSQVQVEPTDRSLKVAIEYARSKNFSGFVAVGGGSTIDTAKAANLYMCNPNSDFLDFVNAPVGKGLPVPSKLKPLIAVPTTAGTGSETTGISIFDLIENGAKTGIRDRALKPTLGIIDSDHLKYCGKALTAFTGLDVLCHALESFTAIPYFKRGAAPSSPLLRPAYQGCNPISDIWSGFALQQCQKYITRAVEDDDPIAREQMALASTAAGVGFGNAGVHLCHGMSYPIASKIRKYKPSAGLGYDNVTKSAIVPHGLSVILTAPEVFRWTAVADYDRHLKAAELLGANVSTVKSTDAGLVLADTVLKLLDRWSDFIPDGLNAIGYEDADIDMLVHGTLPQRKVLDISPRQATPDDLGNLFMKSMKLF